jgi:dolichol-phosphate mannosyltransferase
MTLIPCIARQNRIVLVEAADEFLLEQFYPMKLLTLVVTYNEADNIARLIPEIRKFLPAGSVLVIDDNSPDGTSMAVRAVAEQDARVTLICRKDQRGYGSAMIAGMQHAIANGYDTIVTLDADFSHDPADLPRLVEGLKDSDVAVGSRYSGGVRVLNWEVRRLLLSLGANAYVRFLSGLACVDCTSGFRAYRASVLQKARLDQIRTTGYAFLPELLFNLGDAKIAEVPICYTERRLGESKMSKSVIAEALVRPWILFLRRMSRATRRRVNRQ